MNRLIIWLKQASHLSLGERKRIYVNSDLRNLILGNFCISCHGEDLWNISAVTMNDCVHQSDSMRKNCQGGNSIETSFSLGFSLKNHLRFSTLIKKVQE